MAPFAHRIISEPIDAPARQVYAIVRDPQRLPEWASGLATGIREEAGHWFADSPMGRVRVDMAPDNDFGVLDHTVTLPDGQAVHNAMRVTPAGDGCVVAFVLLRLPGVDDDAFERDAAHIADDLKALGRLAESEARSG